MVTHCKMCSFESWLPSGHDSDCFLFCIDATANYISDFAKSHLDILTQLHCLDILSCVRFMFIGVGVRLRPCCDGRDCGHVVMDAAVASLKAVVQVLYIDFLCLLNVVRLPLW